MTEDDKLTGNCRVPTYKQIITSKARWLTMGFHQNKQQAEPPPFDDRKSNDDDGEGKRQDNGTTYEIEEGRDDQSKDGE